jgi:hypothetical protein
VPLGEIKKPPLYVDAGGFQIGFNRSQWRYLHKSKRRSKNSVALFVDEISASLSRYVPGKRKI